MSITFSTFMTHVHCLKRLSNETSDFRNQAQKTRTDKLPVGKMFFFKGTPSLEDHGFTFSHMVCLSRSTFPDKAEYVVVKTLKPVLCSSLMTESL
jgi:hypothetical protein